MGTTNACAAVVVCCDGSGSFSPPGGEIEVKVDLAMATLASSTLVGASISCATEDGFLSTSERGFGPCCCKLKVSSHLPSDKFAGNEYSWLRSGRSSAWRRSEDAFAGFRHRFGVVKAGTGRG